VRLRPVFVNDTQRARAREIAECWRTDEGRLCFSTTIANLEKLHMALGAGIRFPVLHYMRTEGTPTSSAKVNESSVECYAVGGHVGTSASVETLRELLRRHGVSMTGKKDALVTTDPCPEKGLAI
jgi:hypothetical protein